MIKKIRITQDLFSQYAKAFLGGLLSGLCLFEGVSTLMPVSIALLWSSSKNPFSGFIWGGVAVLYSHKWLLALHPLSWIGINSYLSLPISIFVWLFCGLFGGLLVFFWSWLFHRATEFLDCDKSFFFKILLALFFSIIWGLSEVFLSQGPLFWIGIGGSLLPENIWLAGWARVFGAGGLAVIQILIGWWIWQLFIVFPRRNQFQKLFLYGCILLLLGHILGRNLIDDRIPTKSINVALWQSNIPIREKYSREQLISLPSRIKSVLLKAKESEAFVLVAPEGTLLSNTSLLEPAPINFLSGGFRFVGNQMRSSLLAIEVGKKKYSEALDKHRLVPLGEWSPKFFFSLSAFGGLQAGEESRLLNWNGPSLVGVICYEISNGRSIANAAFNGGEWILSIANLDPYPLALQKQFLALAQLRSIESGRDLVTVSNTGPTSLIKSTGEIKISLPPFKEELGIVEVELSKKKTFYSVFHEWPLIGLLILNLFLLFRIKLTSNKI